jgi:hypothetical protein
MAESQGAKAELEIALSREPARPDQSHHAIASWHFAHPQRVSPARTSFTYNKQGSLVETHILTFLGAVFHC